MSYEIELKNISKQIGELREKEREIEKWWQIESYEKRADIIGKCYKNKKDNTFYKVIDLDINNEYRCFSLTFTKKKSSISLIWKNVFQLLDARHSLKTFVV